MAATEYTELDLDEEYATFPRLRCKTANGAYPESIAATHTNAQTSPCNVFFGRFSILSSSTCEFIVEFRLHCGTQSSCVELCMRYDPQTAHQDGDKVQHMLRDQRSRMSVFFPTWIEKDDPNQYKRNPCPPNGPPPLDIPQNFSSALYQMQVSRFDDKKIMVPKHPETAWPKYTQQAVIRWTTTGGIFINKSVDISHRPLIVQEAVQTFTVLAEPHPRGGEITCVIRGNPRLLSDFYSFFCARPWPSPPSWFLFAKPGKQEEPIIESRIVQFRSLYEIMYCKRDQTFSQFNAGPSMRAPLSTCMKIQSPLTFLPLPVIINFQDMRQYLTYTLGDLCMETEFSRDQNTKWYNGEHTVTCVKDIAIGANTTHQHLVLCVRIIKDAWEVDLPEIGEIVDISRASEKSAVPWTGVVIRASPEVDDDLESNVYIRAPVLASDKGRGFILEQETQTLTLRFGYNGAATRDLLNRLNRLSHQLIYPPTPIPITMILLAQNNPGIRNLEDFTDDLPRGWQTIMERCCEQRKLNQTQKDAVLAAFTRPITLIVAPPATGKTYVLSAIAAIAKELNQKFLIVAGSNKAIHVIQDRITTPDNLPGGLSRGTPQNPENPSQALSVSRYVKPEIFRIYQSVQETYSDDLDETRHTHVPEANPLPILYPTMENITQILAGFDNQYPGPNSTEEHLTKRLHEISRFQREEKSIVPYFTDEPRLVADLVEKREQMRSNGDEKSIKAYHQTILALKQAYIQYAKGACSTARSSASPLFKEFKPTLIMMDESTQIGEAEAAYAIIRHKMLCRRIVMVGDLKQLPLIKRDPDNIFRLQLSLFERLHESGVPTITLNVQYRSHPDISRAGRLILYPTLQDDASKATQSGVVKFRHWEKKFTEGFSNLVSSSSHSLIFSSDLQPTRLMNPGSQKEVNGTSVYNQQYSMLTFLIVNSLIEEGFAARNIAVMAPYLAQVKLLKILFGIDSKFNDLKIWSWDASQGDEADVCVLDTVRTGRKNGDPPGFISNANRANVAISRARVGRIIVARHDLFEGIHPSLGLKLWKQVFQDAQNAKAVHTISTRKVEEKLSALGHGIQSKIQCAVKRFLEMQRAAAAGVPPDKLENIRAKFKSWRMEDESAYQQEDMDESNIEHVGDEMLKNEWSDMKPGLW